MSRRYGYVGVLVVLTVVTLAAGSATPKVLTSTPVAPNLYDLRGGRLHISYSTTSISGRPLFTYQDRTRTLSFSGDQIQVEKVANLGTVVTVVIRRTIDSGNTTFSLVVPDVTLGRDRTANITTEGITTIHRFSMLPADQQEQRSIYRVTTLKGTAKLVAF